MAHVRIEIVDEDDRLLDPGATGEITVTAATAGTWAHCFRGLHSYHDMPDETARVTAGGRLRTGDIGRLDADGYLYVADRRSDMINRGGSKISPAEVERVLLEHPAVADCIVLGRPSDRLGETVAAVVQTRPGATVATKDLLDHCAIVLSGYKVPADVVVVPELPRNPMGKVVREAARQLLDEPDVDRGS
jgi:acyl-CoA synthetase (AMP-forming)/AMP-acid ligase II